MFDVIVLGKGPAGIQAAVYIKRANLNVLVIGKDGGALARTDKVGNYYGFTQISGPELLEAGYAHAKALGIELVEEEDRVKSRIFGGFPPLGALGGHRMIAQWND